MSWVTFPISTFTKKKIRFQHISLRLAAPRILEDTEIELPINDDRIISGRKAVIEEFPYTLSLRMEDAKAHQSGASVLTTTKVLTCAHIIYSSFPTSNNVELKIIVF